MNVNKTIFIKDLKNIVGEKHILTGQWSKQQYCKGWPKNNGVFNGGRGSCNSKATDNLKRMACEVGVELGKKGYYPDNDDELAGWELYNIYLSSLLLVDSTFLNLNQASLKI